MEIIYHNHHKIPKHMGGTDDPSNLERLTVAEHAEAHRKLYEQFGKKEDYFAWQSLLGNNQTREMQIYFGRKGSETRTARGYKHSLETKKKMSETAKRQNRDLTEHQRKAALSRKINGQAFSVSRSKTFTNLVWITNNQINKRIPKDTQIPNGFYLGRCNRHLLGRKRHNG